MQNPAVSHGVSLRVLLSSCVLLPVVFACSSDQPFAARTDTSALPVQQPVGASRWSDPSTWPDGIVPREGAAVIIPSGREVLLDISTPRLASLRIDGTLRFDDRNVELVADGVMVHGRLEIGTEARPFRHRAMITLVGDQSAASATGMGTKLLGVMRNASLELHGARRTSWLRLGANAAAGASRITLERVPDDWRVGDRIVIASTDRDPSHAETVVIAAINGASITLTSPLRFAHWGTLQTIAGREIDERAEVGMLTRNIVIRGDSASSAGGFGGHVMVMAGGVAHVDGIGLYYMGQLGLLARYPMHWHMAGDVSGQYVRNSTVWHSFNRCVTVHGSHAATVENNVCYDHVGHGYFLEDGIETRNTIVGNLGLGTHVNQLGRPLLSDGRPATFWITHPDNTVRGNVAAGSESFGFWYALAEHPTGFSSTTAIRPNQLPLREFKGNVAHSAETGLYVDEHATDNTGTVSSGYYPGGETSTLTADFQDYVGYKTSRGVWTRGRVRLLRPVLADNLIGATLAERPGQIVDPFVVGETQNVEPSPAGKVVRGFEFYDGPHLLRNGTFANFNSSAARPAGAIAFMHENADPLDAANAVEGVRLVDANPVYAELPKRDGDRAALFSDRDGSVSGLPGSTIISRSPLLIVPRCQERQEWNSLVCPSDVRFTGGLVYSSVTTDRFTPMSVRRDDGATDTLSGLGPRHTWPTFPVNHEYTLSPSGVMNEAIVEFFHLRASDWMIVSLSWTSSKAYVIQNGHVPMVSDVGALRAATSTSAFFDAASGRVYVKMFGAEQGSTKVMVSQYP